MPTVWHSWQRPMRLKRPASVVIDSATDLLMISSPDNTVMSLYDIIWHHMTSYYLYNLMECPVCIQDYSSAIYVHTCMTYNNFRVELQDPHWVGKYVGVYGGCTEYAVDMVCLPQCLKAASVVTCALNSSIFLYISETFWALLKVVQKGSDWFGTMEINVLKYCKSKSIVASLMLRVLIVLAASMEPPSSTHSPHHTTV